MSPDCKLTNIKINIGKFSGSTSEEIRNFYFQFMICSGQY